MTGSQPEFGTFPVAQLHQGYLVPGDRIALTVDDPLLLQMADRLWERCEDPRALENPVRLRVAQRPTAMPVPEAAPLDESWTVERNHAEMRLDDVLGAEIDVVKGQIRSWVQEGFVQAFPGAASRFLLEIPAAALLARRAYTVLHAGAVAGPAGALVIRGAAGAGKSTLVAALHLAGLETLGDETVLVSRDDPDRLLAGLREIELEPDVVPLLGAGSRVAPAARGKLRLRLTGPSEPRSRCARRVATILLGSRAGQARLEPLDAVTFQREFGAGAIPEESWGDIPPGIAEHWSRSGAYRLTGAANLAAAVAVVAELAGHHA